MTENKRFKNVEEKLDWGTIQYFTYNDKKLTDDEIEDLVNLLLEENKKLKASLYAEKTNTAEVVNDYAKQFKRHSAQFSFMMDLAEDLGVDVRKLEALDD